MYNSCLHLEHFPSPWKLTTVVMIPKADKNKKEPANHRPIFFLNSMAKLLESLFLSRLKITIAPLIHPEQFAFRGHSITIQLTKLIDELVTTFNRKERTTTIFSLRKSF